MLNEVSLYPKGAKRLQDCHCLDAECRTTKVHENFQARYDNFLAENIPHQVNSWYRCVKHNKEVGGMFSSFHLFGAAADMTPLGVYTLEELAAELKKFFPIVIQYPKKHFCHVQLDRK